jgi:SAM-dependent methyltransferase
MEADPNAAQREFWNGPQGQNWVANQVALDATLTGVSALLLDEVAAPGGARILDVGCGAGDTTIALARAVGPRGTVTGVDISEPLLALARARAEAAEVENAVFLHADAALHRFEPESVDRIVSRFGVMFFADPVAAFRNLAPTLRNGGALVFVAWAAPDVNPWFSLPLAAAVERLGPAEPSSPEAPGPTAFRDIGRVVAILEAAGFAAVRGEARTVELSLGPDLDAAAGLALRVGPATRHIRDKGGDETDARAIADGIRARFAPYLGTAGVRVPAVVNVFRAGRG